MSDENKITALTKEQEVEMQQYLEKYLAIGYNNDEADRSIEEEINFFYKELGQAENPLYAYVDNFYEANAILTLLESDIEDPIRDELEAWIIDRPEQNNGYNETIPSDLIAKVKTLVKPTFHRYNIGNINAYWVGYFKFAESIGVKFQDRNQEFLDVWDSLIKKAGYWFATEQLCVVCNRPLEIHVNDNYELHNENGPAVLFRRTEHAPPLYSINGVVVPEKVVMDPENLTIEDIDNEENAEVRRIMIDQMGPGKYLELTEAKLIDGDSLKVTLQKEDTDDRATPRALMEDRDGRKWLVSSDSSTKRIYFMQVPENVMTCKEAGDALAGGRDESKIVAQS